MNKAQLISLVTSKTAVGVVSALVGAAAGATGSYFWTKKRMDEAFEKSLAEEVEETKRFYSKLYKKEGYSTPQEAAETLGVEIELTEEKESVLLSDAVTAMTNYAGVSMRQDEGDGRVTEKKFEHIKLRSVSVVPEEEALPGNTIKVVERNVFKDGLPITDEDGDDELSDEELFEADTQVARDLGTVPYVISFEEFMQAEPGYQQPSLTFFSEDDVLLDDKDEVIEDIDKVIGYDALQRFGYHSKNNDIVYVRNPVLELDFEVTRSRGSFATEVLGLKHSMDHYPARRFRSGDDG